MMSEESEPRRELRFCPYCFQQRFDLSQIEGKTVYCEVCGVSVEVKDLVK